MHIRSSVVFHGQGIHLLAGEATYNHNISDAVKTALLTNHPTWFTPNHRPEHYR